MNKEQLSIIRPFDILGYSGQNLLCDTIRIFEIEVASNRSGHYLQGIINGIKDAANQGDPIHSAVAAPDYNPTTPFRYEMTAPSACKTDMLPDLGELVGVYRCPWLQPETNPECWQMLRNDMAKYWNTVLGLPYGYVDLVAFPFLSRPISEKHLVCSETVINGFLKAVDTDPRFPCRFPSFFKIAGKDNSEEVGNVSPYDITQWANNVGCVIWEQTA